MNSLPSSSQRHRILGADRHLNRLHQFCMVMERSTNSLHESSILTRCIQRTFVHLLPNLQLGLSTSDSITRTTFPKHLLQVRRDLIRNLPRSKMASLRLLRLVHHWPQRATPSKRNDRQLLWRIAKPQLDLWNILIGPIPVNAGRCVCRFVVYTEIGRRARR